MTLTQAIRLSFADVAGGSSLIHSWGARRLVRRSRGDVVAHVGLAVGEESASKTKGGKTKRGEWPARSGRRGTSRLIWRTRQMGVGTADDRLGNARFPPDGAVSGEDRNAQSVELGGEMERGLPIGKDGGKERSRAGDGMEMMATRYPLQLMCSED